MKSSATLACVRIVCTRMTGSVGLTLTAYVKKDVSRKEAFVGRDNAPTGFLP